MSYQLDSNCDLGVGMPSITYYLIMNLLKMLIKKLTLHICAYLKCILHGANRFKFYEAETIWSKLKIKTSYKTSEE